MAKEALPPFDILGSILMRRVLTVDTLSALAGLQFLLCFCRCHHHHPSSPGEPMIKRRAEEAAAVSGHHLDGR